MVPSTRYKEIVFVSMYSMVYVYSLCYPKTVYDQILTYDGTEHTLILKTDLTGKFKNELSNILAIMRFTGAVLLKMYINNSRHQRT